MTGVNLDPNHGRRAAGRRLSTGASLIDQRILGSASGSLFRTLCMRCTQEFANSVGSKIRMEDTVTVSHSAIRSGARGPNEFIGSAGIIAGLDGRHRVVEDVPGTGDFRRVRTRTFPTWLALDLTVSRTSSGVSAAFLQPAAGSTIAGLVGAGLNIGFSAQDGFVRQKWVV